MNGLRVVRVLVNSIRSLGGSSAPGGTRYNSFLNWPAVVNKAWALPICGQIGRAVKVGGKLPINLAVCGYYNAVRPEFGPTWQLRMQVTFIL